MIKFVLVAVACTLAWAAAPAWAQPQSDPKSPLAPLSATRLELRAGEELTVAGFGCASGNQVRFDLYDPELSSSAETVAKSFGTFAQSIRIPTTAQVGRTWLQATCLTDDSQPRVMEAVLLIERPRFVITGVNVAFGLGTTLVVFGLGLLILRDPSRGRSKRRS